MLNTWPKIHHPSLGQPLSNCHDLTYHSTSLMICRWNWTILLQTAKKICSWDSTFISNVETCFWRLILQRNRPDKYWESNSCTTSTLEPFLNNLTVSLHPSQKQKSLSSPTISIPCLLPAHCWPLTTNCTGHFRRMGFEVWLRDWVTRPGGSGE